MIGHSWKRIVTPSSDDVSRALRGRVVSLTDLFLAPDIGAPTYFFPLPNPEPARGEANGRSPVGQVFLNESRIAKQKETKHFNGKKGGKIE